MWLAPSLRAIENRPGMALWTAMLKLVGDKASPRASADSSSTARATSPWREQNTTGTPASSPRQAYATSSAILPSTAARRRSMGGIAFNGGSSDKARGKGKRAQERHASSVARPGAQEACLAIEN
jgi:hypothetical protein